ncbi:MAG TPA: ABC transporter permease [Myxococcales bacterium]|nr:ABC transporter permease [Myxococcales bacterium]
MTVRERLFPPARDPLWAAGLGVAVSLVAAFLVVLVAGKDPVAAFGYLLQGAVGGRGPIGETAIKAGVLILTGLSVAVAFTVGLFNIGGEGQLIWGALAAAVVAQRVNLPGALLIPASLLAAAAAGAAWAFLAAAMKVWRGVHEVISTILLNWIAIHLVNGWLVPGPLAARGSGSAISLAGTDPIRSVAWLPRLLPGSRLDLGLPIALACAGVIWFLLTRTRRGFEWRAVGTGPGAAEASGIPNARRICEATALAGALAGLAGGVLILGTEHRYPGVFRTGYGFDGIAVALVGGATAPGTVAAGIFFGAIRAGATRLQLAGMHPSFAELIQGIAVVLVAAPRLFSPLLLRLRPMARSLGPPP